MGDYDKAIEEADRAVEQGREQRADYKLIARAMTRKGTALAAQGNLEDALQVYRKSLTEHRWACLQRQHVCERESRI